MFEQGTLAKTGPQEGRLARRRLPFSGAKNFRDLGGYSAADGRTVRWGRLYRSDALHKLSGTDLKFLAAMSLGRVIDFRSAHEKERRPNRLPPGLEARVVEIPILDSTTKVWHEERKEMIQNLLEIDPAGYMIRSNEEFATMFTPQMRRFVREALAANGEPLLFHCAAGKDRTGFGAAILLRMLGVPHETVMQDYQLTNQYLPDAYRWRLIALRVVKGRRFADAIRGFMDANPAYLTAAFDALEREHGSFENYIRDGLGLSAGDVEQLQTAYLE